jgi:hypothetical protein
LNPTGGRLGDDDDDDDDDDDPPGAHFACLYVLFPQFSNCYDNMSI